MRIKKLTRYPDRYYEWINSAHKLGRLDILCDSKAEARQLRESLYNFRHAIKAFLERDPNNDELLHLLAKANNLIFSIKSDRLYIHVPK